MFLNEKIKVARIEKKLTQKNLAEKLTQSGKKITQSAIANWEAGDNSPDADTLVLLCKILDKDGNYFFGIKDNIEFAQYGGLNLEGLDEEDIEELNMQIEIIRKRKEKKKNQDN